MRDLAMLIGFLAMLAPVFRYPHIGVLVWCWTAMIVPGSLLFGFMWWVPFNKITAVITLVIWLMSREPRKVPMTSTIVLLAAFAVLGTVSAWNGIGDPATTMAQWSDFAKVMVFPFVVAGLITSKVRIDGLLYAIYLSLGFHGIAEGAKFLISAGGHQVWGPRGSAISDNNHFALAMVVILPIVLYLYRQTAHRILKLALLGSSLLVMASIMGTTSRGGLLGIAAMGGYAFVCTSKKFKYALAVLPLIAVAVTFAPERWSNRMDTIQTADADESFMTRVVAWKLSTLIAMDHPLLGGGFHAVQDFPVWVDYSRTFSKLDFIPSPPPNPDRPHAAHSIYFQVLGDMGFLGLGIYIAILVSTWRNASAVIRRVRDRPEVQWAGALATSLKYSLIAYMVSGAALSLAYFEYMYMIFALLVVLRRIIGEPARVPRWATKMRAA